MRKSKQIKLILEQLKQDGQHPNADQIYSKARACIPNISLGTVYRNLNRLVRTGKIQKLPFQKQMRFDSNPEPHWHFICSACHKIVDLLTNAGSEKDLINWGQYHLKEYAIQGIKLEYQGLCPECFKKQPN